ncbi:hypothetical protein [Novosphingobium aromaticivorans]|nr:hypothetical protein [Novosphingobium aromaticivorans]
MSHENLPAFTQNDWSFAGGDGREGMTLRDWFAGQALACVYSRFRPDSDPGLDDLALQAYAIADAMLAERSE